MKTADTLLWGMIVGIVVLLAACVTTQPIEKIDDWEYHRPGLVDHLKGGMQTMKSMGAPIAMSMAESSLGFSVGGAKDINNFRENIQNNYLPLPTDITYEGLFYDYYFDTGKQEICRDLFCPSYSYAMTNDPLSGKTDHYMTVGLNSGMKQDEFKRKKLNLVLVLDISGSMGSSFDKYYYDQFGKRVEREGVEDGTSKMQVAREALVALLGHLTDDDRVGIVLFDDDAYLAKPIRGVRETDMEQLKRHILELTPQGGTNMAAGMKMASELVTEYTDTNHAEYETRIIFLTDAMPNLGETSEEGMLGMARKNAEHNIYTTFIGIGVDFNTELIEAITKTRGANYYSVHSSKEFKERMDEQFEYMVTPLVFNLQLTLDAPGYEILQVYGSPEANEATGEIMKVNTLFPSKTSDAGTKGGVVLLKLKKKSSQNTVRLTVTYEDRLGKTSSTTKTILLKDTRSEYFENKGIRKSILLARYADLMKNWLSDERELYEGNKHDPPRITFTDGIIIPEHPWNVTLSKWERQSVPLQVSEHYRQVFTSFATYFKNEMNVIGDQSLEKEGDILDPLGNLGQTNAHE